MGLLKIIEERYPKIQNDLNKVSSGLLTKAEKILLTDIDTIIIDKPFYTFHNFAEELGISSIVLFLPVKMTTEKIVYIPVLSHGLNYSSPSEIITTSDFWTGTFNDTNTWNIFTNEEVTPYLQLFTKEDIQKITQISIKKFNLYSDNFCYCLIPETSKNTLIDLDTLNIVLPSLLSSLIEIEQFIYSASFLISDHSKIDYLPLIEKGFSQNNTSCLLELDISSLVEYYKSTLTISDLYFITRIIDKYLSQYIKLPNFLIYNDNSRFNIILFFNNNLDIQLYTIQMQEKLQKLFYKIDEISLSIVDKGKYHNVQKLCDSLGRIS